jgi:hypothetical protein
MNDHEKALVSSIEKAIHHTTSGMSPNDAITKVASDEGYGPELIKRMVEGYNKSKSVDYLSKAASDTRANAFPLADINVIMKNVYEPVEKVASSDFRLPIKDFSQIDFGQSWTEKLASFSGDTESKPNTYIHPASVDNMLRKQAHVQAGIKQRMHDKVAFYKVKFEETFNAVVDHVAPMGNTKLQKFATNIINGYQDSGRNLVKAVAARLRRDVSNLDKTANYTIFPTKEPYLTVTKLYQYAEKMAQAEVALDTFEKKSFDLAGVGKSLAGSLMADKLTSDGDGAGKKVADLKDLDPKTYNDLRGIDAQRMFTNLALYDPELQKYDVQDLAQAYNTASKMGLANNEVVLKNAILSNLQSGGLKDKFELSQELDIAKKLKGGSNDKQIS